MPTIAQLGLALCTTTVSINGRQVSVRAVSVAEMDLLRSRLARPVPPMGPDPSKGSNAPWVPDENDAEYQREMARYLNRLAVLKAAVAIDYEPDNTTQGRANRTTWGLGLSGELLDHWISNAERDLGQALTDRQVNQINTAAEEAGTRAAAEAEKN